jgi:tetrahedral aminopeptidase
MELLIKLMNTYGISGSEERVRETIKSHIEKYVDEVYVDKSGNLVAHKKGKKPRVMLAAHMDEIGLMVSKIDEDGRIRFTTIGGIEPISLVGQRVHISGKENSIKGVVTTQKFSDGSAVKNIPRVADMFIDTGLSRKELRSRGVRIGSYLGMIQETGFLGNSDILYGKALDDRIGCYILVELAKRIQKTREEVYFVFTVQEEVGLYGAKTAAYNIQPDWAIAVDITSTDDAGENPTISIGKGPCITVKDAEFISNKCINRWLQDIAEKKKILVQMEVTEKGTTDAVNIYLSRGGVPSTVVCVPVRNSHSTIGIAHRKDIEDTIKLLELLLKNSPKVCLV